MLPTFGEKSGLALGREMVLRSINRRTFLALSAAPVLVSLRANGRLGSKRKGFKKRRVLFNWDGSAIHCWGRSILPTAHGPLTRQQFVSLVFTPIEGTAVDTVFFSFGSGNVAEYQSNVLEWPGEADHFQFPQSTTWHGGIAVAPQDQYWNPKSLAEAGHNPPAVIVAECHKRGLDAFVSLRMNDIHDGQHPRDTWPNPELPTFKRQNPDWLVEDLEWWSALNYSLPQVRELKLKVIEEFFDRWDFDGIELDWLRHTLYFSRGTEREKGKYLTAFMRSVRRSLNERAARRGRPIEVAVRIPERVEWCLEGGFEVPLWIEEDLVDLLILGQGLTELPTLSQFRKLMIKRRLPIYPCLASYGNGYRVSPDEVIRGSAATLWRDGADGLYTFNWLDYGSWRRHLLKQIGDPHLLVGQDKHYTLPHRFEAIPLKPGADIVRYNTALKAALIPFELKVGESARTLSVRLADDLTSEKRRPKRAELWIAVHHSAQGDLLDLSVNGLPLGPVEIESSLQASGFRLDVPPGNGRLGFPEENTLDMTFPALRFQLPPRILRHRHNRLSLRLKKRGGGAERPLQVSRVELLTRF